MAKKQVKKEKKRSITEENLDKGLEYIYKHDFFSRLDGFCLTEGNAAMGKNNAAVVFKDGYIHLNKDYFLEPLQWAYAIAHCELHLAFGHFDAEKMPGYEVIDADGTVKWNPCFDKDLWMAACDIYITKFLEDMKFGKSIYRISFDGFHASLTDEKKIYEYLQELGTVPPEWQYDTASPGMVGLENPIVYEEGYENRFIRKFVDGLVAASSDAVIEASGEKGISRRSRAWRVKEWFINRYPLLGGLTVPFRIIEDSYICQREEISIAAIDVELGEIYINPRVYLSEEEMKFVVAHELLHAGLQHRQRCQGRDSYLWNVACDYVINGWLVDMEIGAMPEEGLLYDKNYKNWSAESIYEELIKEIRKNRKLNTFRGYGQGDMLDGGNGRKVTAYGGITLDEFCKNALALGLEYHTSTSRGYIPAGLIEEIRALAMPPIPWDVELAKWFDCFFSPLEKSHTYARPSRRQGATPEIPRPRYVKPEIDTESRTFGVVVDTSGSMSAKMIGMALGSIASYAAAKDVALVRVIFCDADAYDAGYMSPEEIAGRVEVKGRGGTILQPGVDLLEKAKDFPKDGPILLITDGEIEDKMNIHHQHAFLIPQGKRLPFKARGKVFYFS